MKAAAYLLLKDNAREVIDAYRTLPGIEVVMEHHFREGMTENPALIGKVFHAELRIGDLNLYLCDTDQAVSFDAVKFVVEISEEETARAFLDQLAHFGKVIQDFTKMPFGPEIAQAEDRFGIKWDVVIC